MHEKGKTRLFLTVAAVGLLYGASAFATQFNVPAQSAKEAIPQFAIQAGIQIVAPVSRLDGVKTAPVVGNFDTITGLNKLLVGTNLEIASQNNGIIALRVAASSASSSTAAPEEDDTVVIVTGIRKSIYESARLKRAAVNIADSIVAEDIGKLPDQNVAEALQRAPGVAVGRDKGEGKNITVRGLGGGFNVTTMNGRRIASEDFDRQFNYDMLASEVVSRVDINKTPQARMPEGGIGAVVDVKTWRPFDLKDGAFVFSGYGVYGDYAGKTNPRASILYSRRLAGDKLGILVSANYSKSSVIWDQAQTTEYDHNYPFDPADPVYSQVPANMNFTLPRAFGISHTVEDRERIGATVAVQWRPTDNIEANFDALFSQFTNRNTTQNISYILDQGNPNYWEHPTVLDANIDGNGNVLGLTWGAAPGARNPYSLLQRSAWSFPRVSKTSIVGGNIAWTPNDTLKLALDVSYSRADQANNGDNWEIKTQTATHNSSFDWSSGELPSFTFSEAPGSDFPTQIAWVTTSGDAVLDQITQVRFAGEWQPGKVFDVVNFGLEDSKEQKDNTISRTQTHDGFYGGQVNGSYYDTGLYGGNGFNFAVGDIGPQHGFVVPTYLFSSPVTNFMPQQTGYGFPNSWDGIDMSGFLGWLKDLSDYTLANPRYPDRPAVATGAFELLQPQLSPLETYTIKEEILTSYVEGTRTASIGDLKYRLNAGLRVSRTTQESAGFTATSKYFFANDPYQWSVRGVEWNDAVPVSYRMEYTDVLPSLNVTFYPTDKLLARLSIAKVMSRAPLGDLRPGLDTPDFAAGTIKVGNPDLKPFRALQYDATLEYYYSRSGSVAVAGFYKDIDTFIANGIRSDTLTFTAPQRCISANYCFYGWNGVQDGVTPLTTTYNLSGPFNSAGAKLYGSEFTWQQDFGDWISRLRGAGILFNLTYAESETALTDRFANKLPIESLSKYSYNLTTYYENKSFGARLAYNWRSQYLQQSGSDPIYHDPIGWLDANAYWNLSKNITLNAYGTNLLDSQDKGTYGRTPGPYNDHLVFMGYSGRSYGLGLRVKY